VSIGALHHYHHRSREEKEGRRTLAIAGPDGLDVAAAVIVEDDPRSQRGLGQEHNGHHKGHEKR
jgi:hypothetical protein